MQSIKKRCLSSWKILKHSKSRCLNLSSPHQIKHLNKLKYNQKLWHSIIHQGIMVLHLINHLSNTCNQIKINLRINGQIRTMTMISLKGSILSCRNQNHKNRGSGAN